MGVTWLADALRAGGLTVVEHQGWQARAVGGSWSPTYGVVHGTGAPPSQPDSTQIAAVRDGHSLLDGPIANACIDHSGRWHVLAGGRCNSTLVGSSGTPFAGRGNGQALSTEACNNNTTEPWSAVQYEAYARGWAAWCKRLGWPASRLIGHKEHNPGRKIDPSFDMRRFRADVARFIEGGEPITEGGDIVATVFLYDGKYWISRGDATEREIVPGVPGVVSADMNVVCDAHRVYPSADASGRPNVDLKAAPRMWNDALVDRAFGPVKSPAGPVGGVDPAELASRLGALLGGNVAFMSAVAKAVNDDANRRGRE